MSLKNACRKYLADLQRAHKAVSASGGGSSELALRPVVHSFISEVVSKSAPIDRSVELLHDVKYDRNNRPDWRVEDRSNFGVYCFGDHKALDVTKPFVLSTKEQEQIDRYVSLGRPVFVFDGIEFLFFAEKGKPPVRRVLAKKEHLAELDDWSRASVNTEFESSFRSLLQNPGFRRWSELELVEQLAMRARVLMDEMTALLHASPGSGASEEEESLIKVLSNLREIVSKHHDVRLREERACASFVAQVLTFGLFYAHTQNGIDDLSPEQRVEAIDQFWRSAEYSDQANELRPFRALVETLGDALEPNNALGYWFRDLLALLAHAEQMGVAAGDRNFHTLFEKFLEKFDNAERYEKGAFYTPMSLSRWMVRAVDTLAAQFIGKQLKDFETSVIDPCCGTGTFLEAFCTELGPFAGNAPRLTGFEILPAPYALANYRISPIAQSTKESLKLKILLTDTLSDYLMDGSVGDSEFCAELNEARLRCLTTVTVVIGNPPSTGVAVNAPRAKIEAALNDFRPPPSQRGGRQNVQKALNNEAIRFLRWSADRVLDSGLGVLALVLPGSFAHAVSYSFARKWLLERFERIFVMELDADARNGESSQSMFSVQQGRLVIFAVTAASQNPVSRAEVFHLDITGRSLAEKHSYLEREFTPADFKAMVPEASTHAFRPTRSYPIPLWNACWPLTGNEREEGIFISKCSALKLSPVSALFHTQAAMLHRRSVELGRVGNDADLSKFLAKWFKGQAKPPRSTKLSAGVRSAVATAVKSGSIKPYTYRPFVHGSVIDCESVYSELGKVPGDGMRSRPEVRAAFDSGAVAIAVAPSPVDIGTTLTRFAAFVWSYPDNDIAARGNAMIYASVFARRQGSAYSVAGNLGHGAAAWFANDPAEAVFYTYAVMSSSAYRNIFEGILYRSADPSAPPRLPLFKDAVIRNELSRLGKSLAECERAGYSPSVRVAELVDSSAFTSFSLKSHEYDPELEQVVLVGEGGEKAIVRGITEAVYELEIAGHNVIEKWLRERAFKYLRRQITASDIDEFTYVINALVEQEAIIGSIDALIESNMSLASLISPS